MSSNGAKDFFRENLKRSLLKAFSYRIIVVIADFLAVFFLPKEPISP